MRPRQQLEQVLRRVGKATPARIRGPLGRVSRRFRPGWGGPVVTIVLAVSDDETTRIGPCLDSLRAQSHRTTDIVVVPYGSSSRVRAIAHEHAAEDWRIRVVGHDSKSFAEARNHAAARCRGTYLLFAAGGDDLPPSGVARLVESLERSSSSLAVGALTPRWTPVTAVDSPHRAAHRTEVRATTLVDTPAAVTDLAVGNRLFRSRFWRDAGLEFSVDTPAGTDVALAAYARAASFDLLTKHTYSPTNRVEGVGFGAAKDVFSHLDAWLDDHLATWRAIEALGVADVTDWWLWGVLDAAIQPFLDDAERATQQQWENLRAHVERLLETSGQSSWSRLRAESRVKLWLLRNDRRDQLEEFVTARAFERGNRPTEVVDGRVLARLPFFGDEEVGIPDDWYQMGESETPFQGVLHGVRWVDPRTIELDVYARVEFVGFVGDPVIDVRLMHLATADEVPVAVRRYVDPGANRILGHKHQDYSRGALTITVDAAELSGRVQDAPGSVHEWALEIGVTTSGISRRGPVSAIDDRGSAGMVDTGHLAPRLVDGVRVGVRGEGSEIRFRAHHHSGPKLKELGVTGRRITGTIEAGQHQLEAVRVSMTGGLSARAPLTANGADLGFSITVPHPWAGSGNARWTFHAISKDGAEVSVGWPADAGQWLAVGQGEVVATRSATGDMALVEAQDTLVLDSVHLADGAVTVDAHWLGPAPKRFELRLQGRRATSEAVLTDGSTEGRVSARLPLTHDEWGLGAAPLPSGRYWFEVACGEPHRVKTHAVLVGSELLDRLLFTALAEGYRFRPIRSGRAAGVFLEAPLTDDEAGPWAQQRLQDWYRDSDLPIDQNVVYLQSYNGLSATDSQLAIHHELRRRHPELLPHWGVADRSSIVPEGGVPVLMHSREWYRVMASARYLSINIDFDRWFSARPGQRVLQTFHGYPAKSMGIRMWEAKRYTPRRIELELARTSADWDLILTPAPEMDVYYRTEYRYDGKILSAGYPRDDMLVSVDAVRTREDTRSRLGIEPSQKVVLYAPTWRDDLATDWRSAELVHHLDLETASRKLGSDYVFLMRGHRFHALGSKRAERGPRLLDVTNYPEINDLILAADAAVLDYSSLRFDFALTGRPMVFLVPDLDQYTGGVRGFLYDFRDSAPGPLVNTADQAVDRLRDLPGLQREYAEEQARFHQKYNYLQDGRAAERVVKEFFG